MSVNKVILVGHLGMDPEARVTQAGLDVCTLSVATNHVTYDENGNKKELVEWHRVILFKRLAEIAAEYLRKGSQAYIEGRLKTRKYEKDGEVRYITEIIGEKLQMLSRPESGGANGFQDPETDSPF